MRNNAIAVKVYDSPLTMRDEMAAWLEEQPAVNNLLLGLLYRLARRAEAGGETQALLIGVFADGEPKLAALHMPPRSEIVISAAETGWEESMQALIAHFKGMDYALEGSVGPEPQNSLFAQGVAAGFEEVFEQRIWQIESVTWPRPAAGKMRLASPKEAKLLVQWAQAFFREALDKELPFAQAKQLIEGKLLERNFFVWDHEGARCMAGVERPTAHGLTVVLVYTPAESRGHGYASNLVAQLTDLYLRKGRKFLCLHTDANFGTSNKIYESIGYYSVGQGSILRYVSASDHLIENQ